MAWNNNRQGNDVDFALVLASSVHDMKNSLGMLLNSLEETVRELPAVDAEQKRRFATLQYEASRINSELIQLLSLYRMDQQAMPLHVDEQYVVDVLDEQLARNAALFDSRGLSVTCDCDPDLVWYFDAELVGGVVHNLLVNCARYTKNRLQLSARVHGQALQISVADDGDGYPAAMIEQPVNMDKGVVFETGSTNLGLYFAQAVARLHRSGEAQGGIALRNGGALGGGEFTLTLP